MWLDVFKKLIRFYLQHKTFKVSQDETSMKVFKYFVSTDMILKAMLMQAKNKIEQEQEETLIQQEEKNNNMELESFLHDDEDFDTLTEAEVF